MAAKKTRRLIMVRRVGIVFFRWGGLSYSSWRSLLARDPIFLFFLPWMEFVRMNDERTHEWVGDG